MALARVAVRSRLRYKKKSVSLDWATKSWWV